VTPQPLPVPFPLIHVHSVRAGCWLLNYTPTGAGLVAFDGTMRVEAHHAGRTASGDLCQRPIIFVPPHPPFPSVPVLLPGPRPANGIPILSRGRYRYYLRITQILEILTLGTAASWALRDVALHPARTHG